MNILFLIAKLHSIEPFGVMHLVPHLKQAGHTVKLMDAEDGELLGKVTQFAPDIVGYSVCTGSECFYAELNRWLKTHLKFVAVCGGPHPTFFPDFLNEDGIDAICRGEGDYAFVSFCEALERSGKPMPVSNFTVKATGGVSSGKMLPLVSDLDSLPFPDRDIYYGVSEVTRDYPVRSFLAARGCPFSCSYCFNHAMDALYGGNWKHMRIRSPDNLVSEICTVTSRYPTEFIAFRESIFPLSDAWLAEFAEKYRAAVNLPFYCHLRLDLLTEAKVRLLAHAGCYSVNVGIETGDERFRASILDRHMSNETILSASRLLKKYNIRMLATNMLGLPGGGLATDLQTLKLNQQCGPDYSLAMLYQPYPGTRLAERAQAQGQFAGNFASLGFSYYRTSQLRFASKMEKRRIENLQKLFAVATIVPRLTPLVKLLTYLPPNRFFDAIFNAVYLMFHETEIFPHRMPFGDWLKNICGLARSS